MLLRALVIGLVTLAFAQATATAADQSWKWGPGFSCARNQAAIPGVYSLMTSGDPPSSGDFRSRMLTTIAQRVYASAPMCPAGARRDTLRAYALSLRGLSKHSSGVDWHDDLNLSDQLFDACVKLNGGTELGARCATAIQTNARWRRAWDG
jgi:hypothetical protein